MSIGVLKRIPRTIALTLVCMLFTACAEQSTVPVVLLTPVSPAVPMPPAAHYPTPTVTPLSPPAPTSTPTPDIPSPSPELDGPLTVAVASDLPETYVGPLVAELSRNEEVIAANGEFPLVILDQLERATVQIDAAPWMMADYRLAERFFAVVVPFATIQDDIALEDLILRWQGQSEGSVLVDISTLALVSALLGPADIDVNVEVVERSQLLERLEETDGAIGISPFDDLDPTSKVLTIDGVSPLSNTFAPEAYPLSLAINVEGEGASLVAEIVQRAILPRSNRNPESLTTLMMTGVTAISRGTAAAIERTSVLYPAQIVSATLRAADITHVSNEVPFLDDCEVNNTVNNLVLCSHTDYWATLEAIGTDLVGLSGNHVNDFGREGARRSLAFYWENEIPIYGSGLTMDEACEPLLWTDHGNTFAFLAVLAFGPETAWATDEEPGACYYYDYRETILATVTQLSQAVDIVSVEVQFEESYSTSPLARQIDEFRALREAGADIVTGVQSHVPQAVEPYGRQATDENGDSGIIVYGLGNLFFDQMWSWPTRTGLIAQHTIYQGRLINTSLLTTVLEDFSQPRWAEQEERAGILTEVFASAPSRP